MLQELHSLQGETDRQSQTQRERTGKEVWLLRRQQFCIIHRSGSIGAGLVKEWKQKEAGEEYGQFIKGFLSNLRIYSIPKRTNLSLLSISETLNIFK